MGLCGFLLFKLLCILTHLSIDKNIVTRMYLGMHVCVCVRGWVGVYCVCLCIIYYVTCRSFIAGGHKFVFMVKGPLMFVAVSQGPEYEQQIIQQMTYGYYQILSVLTFTQLHNVFQRKPNFDLRFLLQGNYGDILKTIQ